MGMYTEIYVNVDLKEDTPGRIIDDIASICTGWTPQGFPEYSNRLFKCGSYYTPHTSVASLTYSEINSFWSFLGKGDLKNYHGEVEYFFNWIMPWVDAEPGEFIGYHRYETDNEPTLVYKLEDMVAGGCDLLGELHTEEGPKTLILNFKTIGKFPHYNNRN